MGLEPGQNWPYWGIAMPEALQRPEKRRGPGRMLSVIIATLNSERALVPTLSALVSGATSGLVTDVVVADGGSHDETAMVADIAGCRFLALTGPLGRRLKAATAATRAPWILHLRPGAVLDTPWVGEARHFIEQPLSRERAAVFRRSVPLQSALREMMGLLAAALHARPRPEQGLLISRQLYDSLGGHSETTAEPETDLLRRITRRRIVTLSTAAFYAGPNT